MRPMRVLVLAVVVAAAIGTTGAQAATCTVQGRGGEFQVRRIDTGPSFRRLSLNIEVDKSLDLVVDDDNWHLFGGVWFIEADTGVASYYFHSQAGTGPPSVVAEVNGQRLGTEATGNTNVVNNFGAGVIHPKAQPNETYYLVGFGTGSGTWTGTLSLIGADLDCPLVDVDGEVFDYDASDFTGGTHLMVPGFGHGENIRLQHHNPRKRIIGALFAHMPEPFPPASIRIDSEVGSGTVTQDIRSATGFAKDITFTANYTGQPQDAPLIRLLQLDLDIGR